MTDQSLADSLPDGVVVTDGDGTVTLVSAVAARMLGTDPDDTAIVRAIISLGRALDLHLVAEGVETPTQLAELQMLGCDLAQGYLFSRPVGADAFTAWLTGHDPQAVRT